MTVYLLHYFRLVFLWQSWKHFPWHHHQTIFKRTCMLLIPMPMYYRQFTLKKLKRLNVHTTHTFNLDQRDAQSTLVVSVNSDGKIKTSGQILPKVTRTLHIERLSFLLNTWTCPRLQGWIR